MKTKKPSAIVYNWDREGEVTLISDVYFEEYLHDEVIIYSLPYTDDVVGDYSRYKPDLIVSIGMDINIPHYHLRNIHIGYPNLLPDNILANDIVCNTVFKHCEVNRPRFSIFTPTYKTGERIKRTYDSLAKQTFTNWEWVVVDDSPDNQTWNILNEIAKKQ
jgi:hypothetical protein